MPVQMKPTSEIKIKLGIEPDGRVQKFFTNTCYKHMDKYVPQDMGNLRTVVDVQPTFIVYEQEYAGYQYYGQRKDGTHKVAHYTTPGTGPFWDKKMVSAEMKDVVQEVQNYINHGG